jgi:hypothetical protein
MATIMSDVYLDGGTARTAGEAWVMNGGVLTVRTDTRWHADKPAGMTGSLGAATISATLGGGVLLDGRDVRWMPFDTGAGVVPAIGTTITQGGVSGYLLGVWTALNVAPTTVGAAMPASGYLKFREVTGGPFAIGALTGISANATDVDVTGWIEVVRRQSTTSTIPRLGFYRTRGDWFYLDSTTGSANQIIQTPTNGGGAGTVVPAIWIETGVGTNVYEHYPAALSANFIPANIPTDIRGKFVESIGDGRIRIGFNGTSNVGYVPPAGCRVRIPNIIGRQTSAANDAVNLGTGTFPSFTTTTGGEIDFENFTSDWAFAVSSAYKVRLISYAGFANMNLTSLGSPMELEDVVFGMRVNSNCLTLSSCVNGGTIENCTFYTQATFGSNLTITDTYDLEITNLRSGVITYARGGNRADTFTRCSNITIDGYYASCLALNMTSCNTVVIKNYDVIDRLIGSTITTHPLSLLVTVGSNNLTLDGFSVGLNNTFPNIAPYTSIVSSSVSSNITIRNGGTLAAPLSVNPTFAPANIFQDNALNNNIRLQNINVQRTRFGVGIGNATSKQILFENCTVGTVGSLGVAASDAYLKGARAASNTTTGSNNVYGTHWMDMFDSDTQGRIWLAFNEPSAASASQFTAVSLGVGAGFTSTGSLVMPNLTDEVIWEMPYFALGHTAFDNSAPVRTGTNTGNFNLEYQVDLGSGYSGTWQALSAANLVAEGAIDPSIGARLKLRVTVGTASTTNALTNVRVTTDSTLVAQQNNLYPQDYAVVTFTGLIANSRVQLYDTTNNAEIFNDVVTGTTMVYSTPYIDDFAVRVRIMNQNGTTAYEFLEFNDNVTLAGLTRPIAQVLDDVYNTNAIDGSAVTGITIDDANLLVEIDTGALTWQDIYAYETYWLYTEEGIRDESRFIEAVDTANYILTDFKIKNVSFPSAPLSITGGWGRDSVTGETVTLIDVTGGTIFSNPDLVIAYDASGGGGGATAEEVWEYSSRTLTQTIPTAAQNATAVRSELTTELDRIDVDISTRSEFDSTTDGVIVSQNNDKTDYVLANNSITSSVIANNALNNSAFTTGYFNAINAEVDTALADYDAPTKAELDAAIASIPSAPSVGDIWSEIIEDTYTASDILRILTAVSAGSAVGLDGVAKFKSIDGTKDRVESAIVGNTRTTTGLDADV